MAFKLKQKDVEATGLKASPFKINQALVMGAADSAKKFTDVRTSFLGGAKKPVVAAQDDDDSTQIAINNTTTDPCQGLEGKALEECKRKVADQEALNNLDKDPPENIDDVADENEEEDNIMMSRSEYKKSVGDAFKRGDYSKYKQNFKTQ